MHNTSEFNRREFITQAAAVTTLGSLALYGQNGSVYADTQQSVRPYVTGVTGKKLVGCYCTLEDILDKPRYIDVLQSKLGVNVLIVRSTIKMPDWLLEMNPLTQNLIMNTWNTDDDSRLNEAIEGTHCRGMDFWLHFTGHHYRDESRHIMGETFDGTKFIDLPPVTYGLASYIEFTTCFEKPEVKAWEPAVFSYAAKMYDVDSMYVTHYRYATPSFWTNLFGCACSFCQQAAERMGYDYAKMRDSMIKLRQRLEKLDRKTLEHFAQFRLTFMDFITLLGEDSNVMDWLMFRAKVVGNSLKRIHDAVHTETNNRSGFITDTHCPTMSLFVGHNYTDLISGSSDALHSLSWAQIQHIGVIAAWANQLCEWVPGLEESTALKITCAFFGWDELGLPEDKIADLYVSETLPSREKYGEYLKEFYTNLNSERLIKLMTHEWTRMAAINRGRIPAHPVIKGLEWPEAVCRELMDRAVDLGLTGYVFHGTDVFIDKEKL